MKAHIRQLKALRACSEAVLWADGFDSLQAAWDACERGNWMLWLLGKRSGEWDGAKRRQVVGIACKCARLAQKQWKDPRSEAAVALAERFAAGENISREELRAAAAAAAAADAAYAAYAAAYAAYAAAAADAAAAYAAAADADADAARAATLKRCAEIVRAAVPVAPVLD